MTTSTTTTKTENGDHLVAEGENHPADEEISMPTDFPAGDDDDAADDQDNNNEKATH